MSGEVLVTIGDLILVRRRGQWVNATVKAISATGARVLATYVDSGVADTHNIQDVFLQAPGVSAVQK